uniref:protein-glutamine gamma-glutamyltransferase n=1 Tax=Cyclopterus lumpus TaxID=8103 RepID=A0A8C2ZK43_CYCLU
MKAATGVFVILSFVPLSEFLDISSVDMMKGPDESNKKQHRTAMFNSDYLIVRRGQEFQVRISFNRPYKPATDTFAVEFVIGELSFLNATFFLLWLFHRLFFPHTAVFFFFLSSDDAVFLDDESERQECVMTEMGIIYHGSYDDIAERNWNYGQFNYGVLDACLYIMDRSDMPITNRGDPMKVTRKASAMLNSRDDDGVLVGNWSGDYTYGVAPTSWTGSTDILLTYASSKMPVSFAQCWVYAAVFNTFLRCLGIPSRVVTNFFSAHDNDGNLKTDIILDESGRIDRVRTRDTIWNYHCWNECYMSRPDLPTGFGGWQVVDATPQETSDGMYRCGPASVQAIKHGHICFPFDAAFVFAEVNSDVVFYTRSKDGSLEPVKVNRTHVGRMVLTKTPGDVTRRDITDQYKFPEGSTEERTVLEKAEQYGCGRDKSDLPEADVDLVLPAMEISVGDDFELSLEFVNRSGERRTVDAYINGSVVYYTGVTSSEFLFSNPTVTIEPNKSEKGVLICFLTGGNLKKGDAELRFCVLQV